MRRLRATFQSGKTKSVEFRKEQLEKLLKMFNDHKDEFVDALSEDVRKVLWHRINPGFLFLS